MRSCVRPRNAFQGAEFLFGRKVAVTAAMLGVPRIVLGWGAVAASVFGCEAADDLDADAGPDVPQQSVRGDRKIEASREQGVPNAGPAEPEPSKGGKAPNGTR